MDPENIPRKITFHVCVASRHSSRSCVLVSFIPLKSSQLEFWKYLQVDRERGKKRERESTYPYLCLCKLLKLQNIKTLKVGSIKME